MAPIVSPARDWWFRKARLGSFLVYPLAVTVPTVASWEHQRILQSGTLAELSYLLVWFNGYWFFKIFDILLLQNKMRSSQAWKLPQAKFKGGKGRREGNYIGTYYFPLNSHLIRFRQWLKTNVAVRSCGLYVVVPKNDEPPVGPCSGRFSSWVMILKA